MIHKELLATEWALKLRGLILYAWETCTGIDPKHQQSALILWYVVWVKHHHSSLSAKEISVLSRVHSISFLLTWSRAPEVYVSIMYIYVASYWIWDGLRSAHKSFYVIRFIICCVSKYDSTFWIPGAAGQPGYDLLKWFSVFPECSSSFLILVAAQHLARFFKWHNSPSQTSKPIRRLPNMVCSSAGLSAAKLLKATGLNPVVLEARDRVGGRTFTVRVRVGPVFFHCSVGNQDYSIYTEDSNLSNTIFRFVPDACIICVNHKIRSWTVIMYCHSKTECWWRWLSNWYAV